MKKIMKGIIYQLNIVILKENKEQAKYQFKINYCSKKIKNQYVIRDGVDIFIFIKVYGQIEKISQKLRINFCYWCCFCHNHQQFFSLESQSLSKDRNSLIIFVLNLLKRELKSIHLSQSKGKKIKQKSFQRGGITSEEKKEIRKINHLIFDQKSQNTIKQFIMKSENNNQMHSVQTSPNQTIGGKLEQNFISIQAIQGLLKTPSIDLIPSCTLNPLENKMKDKLQVHKIPSSQSLKNQENFTSKSALQVCLSPKLQQNKLNINHEMGQKQKQLIAKLLIKHKEMQKNVMKIQKYFKNGDVQDKDQLACQLLLIRRKAEQLLKKYSEH